MRKNFALALAATAASAGLLLAACGSDSDSSSATTSAAAATTTAAAATTVAAVTTTAAVTTSAAGTPAATDIVDTAVAAGNFDTLATALTAAGLVDTLKGPGPFTVFAPTDEAFAKVPKETLDKLLADKATLTKVLTYHVLAGKVMAADVKPGEVETVEGSMLPITVDGSTVKVGDATVTMTDIEASNGVIHVIDSVLIPPDVAL